MANILTTPGVLVLDTAAVISTTNLFSIRKIVLVAGGAAAACEVRDSADRIIASLAAPATSSDEIDFNAERLTVTGLELQSISGAGALCYVYCG
jgi:hypothetical protein